MTHEDLQAVSKALSVIIDKCDNRKVIIEPYEHEEKPKKKLTFSERKKVVREYQEWCYINNALDCTETFLTYLCIRGFIDIDG